MNTSSSVQDSSVEKLTEETPDPQTEESSELPPPENTPEVTPEQPDDKSQEESLPPPPADIDDLQISLDGSANMMTESDTDLVSSLKVWGT